MKKILMISVLGLVAAAAVAASPAAAATTTKPPVTAPPFQGEKPLGLVLYVDTVVSGKASATETEPLPGCAQTSIIHVGQTIVFRMWGTDVKNGLALTEKNVEPEKGAYVVIPGVLVNGVVTTVRIPLAWGEHVQAKTPAGEAVKHSYWTVGVPTKGEDKEPGWSAESSTGALTPIAEKAKIEIPPATPLGFSVHVVTKSVVVEKVVKKKVITKGKNGKKKVVIKKVKKKSTEPGQVGEFTQANFPLSSQLVIEK